MGDITHIAGGPICFPQMVSSSLLFLSAAYVSAHQHDFVRLHVLEHQGQAAGSAPSMQSMGRRCPTTVPVECVVLLIKGSVPQSLAQH